jgi:hypothetical protein
MRDIKQLNDSDIIIDTEDSHEDIYRCLKENLSLKKRIELGLLILKDNVMILKKYQEHIKEVSDHYNSRFTENKEVGETKK